MSVKLFATPLLIAALGYSSLYGDDSAQHGRAFSEHHHSSTLEEGLLNGTGKLLRNMGAGFKDMAEGQRALALAQQQCIANQSAAFRYELERKQLLAELRAGKREQPATLEQMTRWAKAMAPRPLSSDELAADGTVKWPSLLLEPQFAARRESVELALKHLAVETDRVRVLCIQRFLVETCDCLKNELRTEIRSYFPPDYVQSNKFIDSLRLDIQRRKAPTVLERVAVR